MDQAASHEQIQALLTEKESLARQILGNIYAKRPTLKQKYQEVTQQLINTNNEPANTRRQLAKKNIELENALKKVKLLSGLIPICANCKRIRDDRGYWNQVEQYIAEHSEAQFSQGLCPDCMRELYPDFANKKETLKKTT